MLRRIVLAALAAGLVAAVLVTAVQAFTTTPLILAAEVFESGAPAAGDGHAHAHGSGDHGTEGHGAAGDAFPGGGIDRLAMTAMANLVTGVGFALVAVACFALSGRPVDARSGLAWGMAGFVVFGLAPALGLPPELPGMISADVPDRQAWWAMVAGGTGIGLWLVLLARFRGAATLGVILIALPHLLGAPHPEAQAGLVPAELAARFAAAALAVNALFWAALGWTAGAAWSRLPGDAAEGARAARLGGAAG
jgi:cobalt transporter subunit CbtA